MNVPGFTAGASLSNQVNHHRLIVTSSQAGGSVQLSQFPSLSPCQEALADFSAASIEVASNCIGFNPVLCAASVARLSAASSAVARECLTPRVPVIS